MIEVHIDTTHGGLDCHIEEFIAGDGRAQDPMVNVLVEGRLPGISGMNKAVNAASTYGVRAREKVISILRESQVRGTRTVQSTLTAHPGPLATVELRLRSGQHQL